MPLNTVLPSSITEEHRRPATVPQSAVIIVEDDGSIWATTDPDAEGVPYMVDGILHASRAAMVGDAVIAIL